MKKSTPSIGSVGVTVDEKSLRVKVLHEDVFFEEEAIRQALSHDVGKSIPAWAILQHPEGRFTARVIGQRLASLTPFRLSSGIEVREEARIRTSAGLDIVYVGGSGEGRTHADNLRNERDLAQAAFLQRPVPLPEVRGVTFERLSTQLSKKDITGLLEMYRLCFTSYLVDLDESLVQGAAANSLFFVARNRDGTIIASAIGESLRVGPLTLLEVSEEASHPELRVKGAASMCAKMVIEEGKRCLRAPVVPFWEARMWKNIIGMGPRVGLTEYGGILHQHCLISSPPEFTTIPQTKYGSLAVFYAR